MDVQNDFVEGGSLAVAGGREVASRISRHLAAHADDYARRRRQPRLARSPTAATAATSTQPGTEPDFVTTWPVHCVSDAAGSDYAPELDQRHITHHVRKGMGEPAYSAFEGVTDDGRPAHRPAA